VFIKRTQLLAELQAVSPGLAQREIIEQSTSFVFAKGHVMTFNDHVACWTKTALKVEGAVEAKPLLKMLHKLPEYILHIFVKDHRLVIHSPERHTRFVWESEVNLPVVTMRESVLGQWKPLPAKFFKALAWVASVAPTVHLHPDFVEAYERSEAARYTLPTGLTRSWCVAAKDVVPIIPHRMREYCVIPNKQEGYVMCGDFEVWRKEPGKPNRFMKVVRIKPPEEYGWIYFRNEQGLMYACQCEKPESLGYLSKIFTRTGTRLTLPSVLTVK
jgi:hypothetical protein